MAITASKRSVFQEWNVAFTNNGDSLAVLDGFGQREADYAALN